MKKINAVLSLGLVIALQLVTIIGGTWVNWTFNHGHNADVAYYLTLGIALLLTILVYFSFVRPRLMRAPVALLPVPKLFGLAILSIVILGGMFLLFIAAENSVRLLWSRATCQFILVATITSLYPAILEEIVFRDMLVRWTLPRMGFVGAMVLQCVVFSVWHFLNNSVHFDDAINWAIAGLLLGSIWVYTENIFLPVVLHFSNNFFLHLFNGFHSLRTYHPGIIVGEPSEMQFYLIKAYQVITILWVWRLLIKRRQAARSPE